VVPESEKPLKRQGYPSLTAALYFGFTRKYGGVIEVLQEIPLTWKPIRNRSFAGMLGQHQLAYVLQHHDQTTWKWMVSGCNGTVRYDFQSAETLDEAKAAVQASIDQWFRQAGLLDGEIPSERQVSTGPGATQRVY
jgi:hypothetical protein